MRLLLALAALLLAGPALAQSPNPSFLLANRGDQAINELYATPSNVDRWGRDRLEQFSLSPGMTFPVRLSADGTCVYDIRVVYADGKPEERRRVNTCQLDSVAFPGGRTVGNGGPSTGGPSAGDPDRAPNRGRADAPADDPSFRLVNRGRADVTELYVSRVGDDNWGVDRLGDDTVAAGASRVVRLPRGQCNWDVRVVFENGEETEKRRLNLCQITDLRVP